jgi:hypothetical protein
VTYIFKRISSDPRFTRAIGMLQSKNQAPESLPRPDLYGAGYIRPLPSSFILSRPEPLSNNLWPSTTKAQLAALQRGIRRTINCRAPDLDIVSSIQRDLDDESKVATQGREQ